jgi:hypothetical protein
MAYMSQETKSKLAPQIKAICAAHGVKASLAVRHHSTLVLNVSSSPIDFFESFNRLRADRVRNSSGDVQPYVAAGHIQINPYYYHEQCDGPALDFLRAVMPALNVGNHDRSDPQSDYFDVGWYVDVNIGRWNKPYLVQL